MVNPKTASKCKRVQQRYRNCFSIASHNECHLRKENVISSSYVFAYTENLYKKLPSSALDNIRLKASIIKTKISGDLCRKPLGLAKKSIEVPFTSTENRY